MSRRFKIETIFSAIDRMSAPLTRMQNRLGMFARSTRERFIRMQGVTDRWARSAVRGARRAAIGLAALAAVATVSFNSYASDLDQLAKRADRLDFNVVQLVEWEFAAQQSGLTADQFGQALEGLNTRLGQARIGAGSLYSYLRRTDRDLLRQIQRAGDLSEALDLVVRAIERQPDAQRRASLTAAAFGRSNLQIANLASLGADEIDRLRRQMAAMNSVTVEATVDAQRYNDANDRLRRELVAIRNRAFAPLLGTLADYSEQMGQLIADNQELIDQRIADTIAYIVENMDRLLRVLKNVVLAVAGLWALNAVLKVLIGTMTVLNFVVTANPIVRVIMLAVAAIGLLVTGVILWKKRMEEIRGPLTWAQFAMEALRDTLKTAADATGITRAMEFIKRVAESSTRVFDVVIARIDRTVERLQRLLQLLGLADSRTPDSPEAMELREAAQRQAAASVAGPPILSSQERITRQFLERVERNESELIIRDETGRAELRNDRPRNGLVLQRSGGA